MHTVERDKENRSKQVAAGISVASNLILTILKIVVGFISGSVSIMSEGIHSGMDFVAASIAFFSVRKSSQPPDKDHAFGHGKYEDASGLIEALLILAAAAIIIWEAVSRFIRGDAAIDFDYLYLGIIVMGISTIMNFFVSQHLIKVAKSTDSIALESDAWHLRTDVLSSAGVLVGTIIIYFTHIVWIDLAIAIVIGIILLRKSFVLIKKSFSDLMDSSLTDDEIGKITEIIERHESGYTNYHGLKTRKAGSDKFVEFHLMMPHTYSLVTAHALVSHIETEIKSEIPRTTIIVHIDHCDGRCKKDSCTFSCKTENNG
ncbi:MAG TPA: cation diffusion facilitator family transporter [Methanocorpusculum sp.]|nr:cation diffusion facilitator family transporter [Methanocorpusculum sp.]